MRKEKTEQTYRSSEETKQGAPDKEVQAPSMSRGDRSSASHPSTISSNTKSSSSRTLVSSSQAISGRDTDTGSSNSQSSSYGTQRWLDQTPAEEPWNPVGCSRDFYRMENTNDDPNPTTSNGKGNKNSNGSK